jgi:pyruvate dehydrogenase E1 component alpha subunit
MTNAATTRAPKRHDLGDLRLMMRIRHLELRLHELYADGLLGGTTHTCLGQEYVPVTLAPLIRRDDDVFSNHRGHGHFLAHGGDLRSLLAEILGREGGASGGVGGSQHLRTGRFRSLGVQGQSLPVAAGAALHHQHAGAGGLACVYVGDGTWGEGAVYEALNLAALWSLPLLVVVENNGIAQTTPSAAHTAGSIGRRAEAFGVRHVRLDDMRPHVLRPVVTPVVAGVRSGTPAVLEFRTVRVGPHSKGDDTRGEAELQRVRAADWFRSGPAGEREWDEVSEAEAERVGRAIAEVLARPEARWS